MHDDTKQHSLDYGQTDQIASSTNYQHPNRSLNFEEENKKISNPKNRQFLKYGVSHFYKVFLN